LVKRSRIVQAGHPRRCRTSALPTGEHAKRGGPFGGDKPDGTIGVMAALTEITKAALRPRLLRRAAARWPQLSTVTVRFRGQSAYIGATVTGNPEPLKLCRLTWDGSPDGWIFAIYEYSNDRYAESILPGGGWTGTPEAALDCACGLYLGDPTAYFEPPKD
jgi:hypothetical protein